MSKFLSSDDFHKTLHVFTCSKGHDNGGSGDKNHHIANYVKFNGKEFRCRTEGCDNTEVTITCPPDCIGTPDKFGMHTLE